MSHVPNYLVDRYWRWARSYDDTELRESIGYLSSRPGEDDDPVARARRDRRLRIYLEEAKRRGLEVTL